jgi:hypothetical protein
MALRTKDLAISTVVFAVAYGFAACTDADSTSGDCPNLTGSGGQSSTTTSATSTSSGMGGATSSASSSGTTAAASSGGISSGSFTAGDADSTFDHFNDPGESGQKDPFEILKERAQEGPPEVRSRLHGCTKVSYEALGTYLTSRGVNLAATSGNGKPKTAGELYKNGGDALGAARYDARESETYFHTTAGATKLFDIFVQAAPEIIANIEKAPACQLNGMGQPMFDPMTGACMQATLSCLIGRPATTDELDLCNLILKDAAPADQVDLGLKRAIAVATALAAANTCE